MQSQNWRTIPLAEVFSATKSNKDGLTSSEAVQRLKEFGYNEIREKKPSRFFVFLKKFWGLSAWMLEAIIVISLILHKESDALVVAGLLVLNAVISFAQEEKAGRAVEFLKKKLQINSRVLRDGSWKMAPTRELVPGDIVRVRIGDFVPADVKIAQGEVAVDQSALTGESLEIERGMNEILYAGSVVTRGEADGVIVSTGEKSYYGKIAQLVEIAKPKLRAENLVSQVVKLLFIIVAVLLAVAFVVSWRQGANLFEILPLSLVLLLGAIPVALPVMFTVSMAFGSLALAKRGVLVTRLDSLYNAARMDILFADKTGTITENKIVVAKFLPFRVYGKDEVLLYGALASQEANGPIDRAFLEAAKAKNLLEGRFTQKSFVPFDPKSRRTEAIIQDEKKEFRVMKGAFPAVTQMCEVDSEGMSYLNEKIRELAKDGYRVLAIAKIPKDDNPKFVGLAALSDPVKADSKKLIDEIKQLGVSVKMLTGDMAAIARTVARAVGISGNIVSASDLKKAEKPNWIAAKEVGGVAEVYPDDKYGIVSAFQKQGHIVGMTGDGINDAPALKQAEFGIAVSGAADVAKSAAGIVLMDGGLASILDSIKIGRQTFERVNIWIMNKVARTVLKTCFIVFAFFLTGKFVISATAMLVMIFMTDFVKISLSTDNVRWPSKPAEWHIAGLAKIAIISGLVMVAEAFGLLFVGLRYFNLAQNQAALNAFSFEILLFFALFSILSVRERGHFWESIPSKTLLFFLFADMIIGIFLPTFGILGLAAIPLSQILFVVGYTFLFSLLLNDFIKLILLKKLHLNKPF
ncbi:MAG: plasma-membrane proton-efflux P-type ATPase [Patescibacteria group bacterium]